MIINYLKDRDCYLELVGIDGYRETPTSNKVGELLNPSFSEFMTMVRHAIYRQRDTTPKFCTNWIPNHHQVSFDRSVILDYSNVYVPNMYDDSECYQSFLSILSTINNYQDGFILHSEHINLLIWGNIVAFIVAALAIKSFISWITKNGLKAFGWYRIALGIILLALQAAGINLEIF